MSDETQFLKGGTEQKLVDVQTGMFVQLLESAAKRDDYIVVAWPGGRSIATTIKAFLKAIGLVSQEIRSRLRLVSLDERWVSWEHRDSNFGKVLWPGLCLPVFQGQLLKGVNLKFFNPETDVVDYYSERVASFGGIAIAICGVGADGHIAALFGERSASPENKGEFTRSVLRGGEGAVGNYLRFWQAPKPPSRRMTASRQMIMGAPAAVVVILGEEKRAALEVMRQGDVSWKDWPVVMTKECAQTFVVTDLD